MSLNKKMGDKHEADIQERLGGRKTRGSGNQFANPADGRHDRYAQLFAFAWDCKSTRGNSIGVSRDMVEKIIEQSHGERPMLPLRWYDSDRLAVAHDWVALPLDDFIEMMETAALGANRDQMVALARYFTSQYDYPQEVVDLAQAIIAIGSGKPDPTGLT